MVVSSTVCHFSRYEPPGVRVFPSSPSFIQHQAIDDFHIGPFSVYKQTFGAPDVGFLTWRSVVRIGSLLLAPVLGVFVIFNMYFEFLLFL